ncbi:MAG: DUF6691 family protein [Thermodesulfovibrio sp.]|jgi:uncharacterized membrane protein YedE/YeeE|uniref:DUF6691 family protein n=1 Tax=Thermodesulfovibrio obliviosus TaxID=3118332 RepID=A0AAU8GZ67_9BACT
MTSLIYGLITGILFGFLLQRAHVIRYDMQLGALRLKNMTIVKFMLSHIIVAMIGIHLLSDLGLITFSVRTTILGSAIAGGLIFGLGWGLIGYCPGTSIAAVAEGRMDALWGILGMITGAAIFAEVFPYLKDNIMSWGDLGKITLSSLLGLNHWIIIILFAIGSLILFKWFEKRGL